MSDAWDEIQAIKSKRNTLREKLEKRKKERQDILSSTTLPASSIITSGSNNNSSNNNNNNNNNGNNSMTGSLSSSSSSSSATTAAATIKNEYNGNLLEDRKIGTKFELDADPDVEKLILLILSDKALILPINSNQLSVRINALRSKPVTIEVLQYFLQKLAASNCISIKDVSIENRMGFEVILIEHNRIQSLYDEILINTNTTNSTNESKKWKTESDSDDGGPSSAKHFKVTTMSDKKIGLKDSISNNTSDIMSLLSMPSTREKQSKQVGEEILELLSKPTAKERSLAEKFKSQGGAQVMEFCPHGTRIECLRSQQATEELEAQKKLNLNETNNANADVDADTDDDDVTILEEPSISMDDTNIITVKLEKCTKLHFKKIIQLHTDESLGDCSFLNTCFHMDSCKYVHYEVDSTSSNQNTLNSTIPSATTTITTINTNNNINNNNSPSNNLLKPDNYKMNRLNSITKLKANQDPSVTLQAPQWIQCDLRFLDVTVLGKFAVIMADPPWDIHMELPYGTMSDDEMRQLGIPALQDDGLIFLWVTGRAMELGRECLKLWGYERVDELIWVKTNQLQRIIRTGRTGHWLNHGKEHCLVGTKGNQINLNCGLDCDVIVAEVRATSHKPDEIYGIIERLSPGTRKIELFGRPHNVQPNWITLGNQLDGIRLVDPELIKQFQQRYPDGNCMAPSQSNTNNNNNNNNNCT